VLEPPNIPDDELRARLHAAYGFAPTTVEFLPLGLDTRAGVYRVASANGRAFLLKAKRGTLYEASCRVPHYLCDQGIASVVAPLLTQSGAPWTQLAKWTLILYPFIEGVSNWELDLTDAQWRAVGAALRQIHDCALPGDGLGNVRIETFDPSGYARQIQTMTDHFASSGEGDEHTQSLRTLWLAHQATIEGALAAMEVLAEALQGNAGQNVICHADLHASNIIRAVDGRVFVIDWDDVMLAPKERDFLFVGDPPADASSPATAPFFQGYGPAAIDWVALTYYRWERFVQDIIECAESVCFRDDVAEVTRAREAQLCHDILTDGAAVAGAQRAAAHLPGDMMVAITQASAKRMARRRL
jgi:spectinomycin phosphotransferase